MDTGMSTKPAVQIVAGWPDETRVRESFEAARAITRRSGLTVILVG